AFSSRPATRRLGRGARADDRRSAAARALCRGRRGGGKKTAGLGRNGRALARRGRPLCCMSKFSADWLALREPADRAARDRGLARRFAAALPPRPRIIDLGAGTGATARALAPFVAGTWILVDRDAA